MRTLDKFSILAPLYNEQDVLHAFQHGTNISILVYAIIRQALMVSESNISHKARIRQGMQNYCYLGNNRALITLHSGDNFIVETRSLDISVPLISSGRWEPWIEEPLLSLISPGDTVIDCGANMGYYSVLMGKKTTNSGKLYSFEPNPEIFSILKSNIFINGINNSEPHNLAISNKEGSDFVMWVNPTESGGGFLTNDPHSDNSDRGFSKVAIKVAKLDQLIPPGTTIDLLKIDVEGSEPDVLYGGNRLIDESPDIDIVFEVSPSGWAGQGHSPNEVILFLQDKGFYFRLATADEGLIDITIDEILDIEDRLDYTTCIFARRRQQ